MKRWIAFVAPFVAVFTGGLLGLWLMGAFGGRTPPEDVPWVAFEDLDASQTYVRTSGMAHYGVVMSQTVPGNLVRAEENVWLFPLAAPYDTTEGRIDVLVRSTVEPEELVAYELMTVEGWLSRATPDKVPYDVEVKLGEMSGYYFGDQMLLLEADVVEEGLDERAEVPAQP